VNHSRHGSLQLMLTSGIDRCYGDSDDDDDDDDDDNVPVVSERLIV